MTDDETVTPMSHSNVLGIPSRGDSSGFYDRIGGPAVFAEVEVDIDDG